MKSNPSDEVFGKTKSNLFEELYIAAWVAGDLQRPFFAIVSAPSRHGKSLTTFRFENASDTLLLAGYITAQALKKRFGDLFATEKLKKLKLAIVEDESKVKGELRLQVLQILTLMSTGMLSIDQYGLVIKPTRMFSSGIINTIPPRVDNLMRDFANAGAGDRWIVIELELSTRMKRRLDIFGADNRTLPLEPIRLPYIEEILDFTEFRKQHQRNNYPLDEVNLAYACAHVRKDLYDDLIDARRIKEMREAEFGHYWRH